MKKIILALGVIMLLITLSACSGKIEPNKNTSKKEVSNIETNESTTIKSSKSESPAENQNTNDTKTSGVPAVVVQSEFILKQGEDGDKVTALQKKLYTIGYDLAVDGSYGNQTSEAIKKIQKANNIEESGNLDKKTEEIIKGAKDVRSYPAQKPASSPVVTSQAAPAAPQGLTSIPDIKTSVDDSQQAIVVLASSYGTINASFKTYEKINGFWKVINSGSAVTGKKGFSDNRQEGDLTSPTGKYGIPFLFGNANNPGVKLPYRNVQIGDYWVSNKIIDEYNVWMHYDGSDPKGRLYDYEELWTQPLYKYAAVIDYNYGTSKVMGKGSGIFLHIAPYNGGGTLGCIGVSESNLVQILRWLDPAKKPVIVMGVKGRI